MITVTLDTNCFDKKCNKELTELRKLHAEKKIEVLVYLNAYLEKKQYKASEKESRIKHCRDMASMAGFKLEIYAKEIPDNKTIDEVLAYDKEKYNEIFKKVRKIHSPEYRGDKFKTFKDLSLEKKINKLNDWQMLARHIYQNRNFFVTNDERGFIRENRKDTQDKRKKRFESEFSDLKIRRLNAEFIEELKDIYLKNITIEEKKIKN